MMNEIRLLTALELRNLYGFNKFRYSKDKKEKSRYLLLMAVWILVIAMIWFYIGALSYGLILLGLDKIVPAYLTMIASLVILAFGIFKAGDVIFTKKGYDILSSFPIRQQSIVVSRFMGMYVEDLLLTQVIMLPGIAVYGYCMRPGMGFYLLAVVGSLFIPMIPLVISAAIGAIITGIASRMKHKTLAQTILTIAFVVVVVIGSFGIGGSEETITIEMLASLADMVSEVIRSVYLPAVWLGTGIIKGQMGDFLLFIGLSLIAAVAMIAAVSANYHKILRRLFATNAKHDYSAENLQALKSKDMLSALYQREMKRYFSSSIYVSNTIVGPIMALMLSAAIFFIGVDDLMASMGVSGMAIDVTGFVPFVWSGVFTMMTTTSVSISLEGKQFWISQTLPISTKVWLDSKILLNLTLMAPFYLVSEILLILALKPDVLGMLWLILIPGLMMLFAVVSGITINLKLHSFDWEREETVVKQSASAMFGGFAGILAAILCAVLVGITPNQYGDVVRAGLCIALLAVTAWLYQKNNRVCLQKL